MTETPRERRHAIHVRQRDRQSQRLHELERCSHCGLARINVIHETDREHAPEGLAYYADVPFCEFLPTGRLA